MTLEREQLLTEIRVPNFAGSIIASSNKSEKTANSALSPRNSELLISIFIESDVS